MANVANEDGTIIIIDKTGATGPMGPAGSSSGATGATGATTISEYETFYLTSTIDASATPITTWSQGSVAGTPQTSGTSSFVTESSGNFKIGNGYYLVSFNLEGRSSTSVSGTRVGYIQGTNNGAVGPFVDMKKIQLGSADNGGSGDQLYFNGFGQTLVNITNVSQLVRFRVEINGGVSEIFGGLENTSVSFLKIS